MTDLDAALAGLPTQGPTLSGGRGKLCYRHAWATYRFSEGPWKTACARCGVIRDPERARRGKQARLYGNGAELKAARKYGGEKVGHHGGPVDVRGKDFNTQVKTHRRLPPQEWRKAFSAMAEKGERAPRLLLRFLPGPGLPPIDYFVFQAGDFLDWFGRDE